MSPRSGFISLRRRILSLLVLWEHVPDTTYLRYGGEPLESAGLLVDLLERAGEEGAVDTRMPGAFYQLVLPDHRFGALRLEVQHVQVEPHLERPRGRGGSADRKAHEKKRAIAS